MAKRPLTIREFLNEELGKIQARNARFSLRAFAKMLGLSAPHLSQILTGKGKLSPDAAEKIAKKLKLEGDMESYFVLLSEIDSASKGSLTLLKRKAQTLWTKIEAKELEPEGMLRGVRWQHLLLLVILELKNHLTEAQIVKSENFMGVKASELKSLLRDLRKAGLIQEDKGVYTRTHHRLVIASQDANATLKEIHTGYLDRAKTLVKEREPADRYSVTEFFTISKKKMAEVRALTDEFVNEVGAISSDSELDGVLELAIHLNSFGAGEVTG